MKLINKIIKSKFLLSVALTLVFTWLAAAFFWLSGEIWIGFIGLAVLSGIIAFLFSGGLTDEE